MVKFVSEKLTEHVTRIFGLGREQMYLVEGTEKAALIDTGCGVGSLRSYVETLTDKPLIVLITHGHVDHAMGAAEFDTVYMSRKDDYIYKEHCAVERRKGFISQSPFFAEVEESDYQPTLPCEAFLDLNEGDVFDLGGITIEVFACPGHTLGSLCMLFREERTLLTGDSCNCSIFLFADYSTGLTTYENSLRALKEKTEGKFDRIYLSHDPVREHPVGLIDGVLQLCEEIKEGKSDKVPYVFQGKVHPMAKKTLCDRDVTRVDGGIGNIIYDETRIFE